MNTYDPANPHGLSPLARQAVIDAATSLLEQIVEDTPEEEEAELANAAAELDNVAGYSPADRLSTEWIEAGLRELGRLGFGAGGK